MTPDHMLSLAYAPSRKRDILRQLWEVDASFARFVLEAREPMMARIRLAWWKEQGLTSPPPDALGQAVTAVMAAHHDVKPALIAMMDGWDQWLDGEGKAAGAAARGSALFRAASLLLTGRANRAAEQAGALWSAIALGAEEKGEAIALDPSALRGPLLPLGVMGVLAVADASRAPDARWRPGSPRRMIRALGFALFRS